MKVHNSTTIENETIAEEVNACCGTTSTKKSQNADPCCEQPTDGTSCCDKSASQEENSKTTGCC